MPTQHNRKTRRLSACLLAAAVALAAAACSDPATQAPGQDASADAQPAQDAAPDPAQDAAPGTDDSADAQAPEDAPELPEDTPELPEDTPELPEDTADVPRGDTEADAPGEDTGRADTTPDTDLCQTPSRCRSRVVERCDPVTGDFSEDSVCSRQERCREGVCEPLPEVYAQACRSAQESQACEAAGLSCAGRAIIPFCLHEDVQGAALIEVGGQCYGGRDCVTGLCTLEGLCSEGAPSDACRDDLDCAQDSSCDPQGRCR